MTYFRSVTTSQRHHVRGTTESPPVILSDFQHNVLNYLVQSGPSETLARRARIILASATAASNSTIARNVGVSREVVILWRRRFREAGLIGLLSAEDIGDEHATSPRYRQVSLYLAQAMQISASAAGPTH